MIALNPDSLLLLTYFVVPTGKDSLNNTAVLNSHQGADCQNISVTADCQLSDYLSKGPCLVLE